MSGDIPLQPWWRRFAWRATQAPWRLVAWGFVAGLCIALATRAVRGPHPAPWEPVILSVVLAVAMSAVGLAFRAIGTTVRRQRMARREALEDRHGIEWFIVHGLDNDWNLFGAALVGVGLLWAGLAAAAFLSWAAAILT